MRLNADSREQHVIGWGERPAGELAALADVLVATKKEQVWQELALCAETDPESFFPEKGGSTRDAKGICLRCEVKDVCLQYALDRDERFGIWGGLSERERRRLKSRGISPAVHVRGRPLSEEVRDEVFRLIGLGLSNKQVAAELGISPRTAEAYRTVANTTNGTAA